MVYDSRIEQFRRELAAKGQRVTPQRLAIYGHLISTDTHPTADDIYQALQGDYPSMSPATVYKTLELLVQMGLITELGFGDSPNRYDGNPDEHVNLICTSCGTIVDLDVDALGELMDRVAHKSGFLLQTQRHEYSGLCPGCQKQ